MLWSTSTLKGIKGANSQFQPVINTLSTNKILLSSPVNLPRTQVLLLPFLVCKKLILKLDLLTKITSTWSWDKNFHIYLITKNQVLWQNSSWLLTTLPWTTQIYTSISYLLQILLNWTWQIGMDSPTSQKTVSYNLPRKISQVNNSWSTSQNYHL